MRASPLPAPRAAAALDALHPLLGVPVALKDLVSVKGGQCTAGSRILEGYRSPYDAHITERLREVGAVILGKTNMDEFAMGSSTEHSAYGPTANPWDLGRVPGGLAAAGRRRPWPPIHAPLSIGTDTGGSIRQPAAMTGIVGLKPTYGRVSRYGIVAFASSLDQIGPFARDARDAAALLHAVAGRDERDSTSSPTPVPGRPAAPPAGDDEAAATLRGKRLGLPREYFVAGMEPGVEARIREAVAALEAAGAIVEEVSLPHTEYGLATYYIVAPAEASANLARYDGIRYGPRLGEGGDVLAGYLATRGQGFGAEVKRRIMLGTYALSAGYYDAYYLKAQKVRTLIKGDFDALWAQGFDALVAPTSPTVAFRFGARMDDPVAMYLSDACTLPVNMAGLPGISIPAGLSEGLPVGLQLIGAPWSEPALLGLARGYEGITADAAVASPGAARPRRPGRSGHPAPSVARRPPAHADRSARPSTAARAAATLAPGGVPWACVRSCSARPSAWRPGSVPVVPGSGGRPGASTPDQASRRLPGDEIVPEPVAIETRGITIDAPPATVWPWLVQMGYGRAGWYSYDQLDQRGASADEIVPAWQELAVGDILPTHPGGGFEVAILEAPARPGRAQRYGPGQGPGRVGHGGRQRARAGDRRRPGIGRASWAPPRRTSRPAGPSCSNRSAMTGAGSSSASVSGTATAARPPGS